jgi:hypothetical protein
MNPSERPSPLDPKEGAEEPGLAAHVVTPDGARAFGFDVLGDLARSYSFAELVLLSLTGALPDDDAGATFEAALFALATPTIAEASVHATRLARMTGATTSGLQAVAGVAGPERARDLVARHADLLAWLDAGAPGDPPEHARSGAGGARAARDLAALLPDPDLAARVASLTLHAGALTALHAVGLTTPDLLERAVHFAALPLTLAEAAAAPPRRLDDYPLNLPEFRYVVDPT